MVGISVGVTAYIFGDNKYVLCNSTIPDYTLKKKLQITSYHLVSEGVERDKCMASYVNTHDNTANLLTKILPMSET